MISLSNIIFQAAQSYSALTAVKIGERLITYNELNSCALSLAGALLAAGAENEAIGLVGQRKASSYFGILGIEYTGCHYTPINPKYSASRLQAIIKDANIRILVGDAGDLIKLESILGTDNMPALAIIPEGQAPRGKRWIDWSALKNTAPLAAPVSVKKDSLSYLLYTSGSTGLPKGVKVTHGNITAFLASMAAIYQLEAGFRASQTFDFSFDPSVSDMFFTWSQGGQLCVLPEEEMMLPAEYIRREKISFWNSVPSLAIFMNKMGQLSENSFPDLKYSMFCGEQFPKHIADAWKKAAPNSTIENLYGPTEATIYISRFSYLPTDSEKSFRNSIIPIGQPFLHHQVAIIDENGNRVADGETGEICFKGDQVTQGYLHDTAKTDAVFVNFSWDIDGRGKWYKTGDLGFVNVDGYVECIGRRDSQIKLGGRRIEIGEIEAVLAGYPQTKDAVVVPLRDDNDIVTGCVAFILGTICKEEEMEVRQESTTQLERVFFPKKIISLGEFPLTTSGKIDRKALAVIAKELYSKESKR